MRTNTRPDLNQAPSRLEIERRYVLSGPPDLKAPVLAMARPVHIEQTYLNPVPGFRGFSRVRETRVGNTITHQWCAKQKLSELSKNETEIEIEPEMYRWLMNHANGRRPSVHKIRRRFTLHDLVFELDHVLGDTEQWILEVELESEDQEVVLPRFLPIQREVTFERLAP